jgi:hypothetical protein
MTIDERYKYLCRMRQRYRQANREERGRLLTEMQAVTDLHRKSLVRLLNGPLTRKPRRRQRGRTYGPEMESALCIIAESFDYICAERLTPNLIWMAQHLDSHGELYLSPALCDDLDKISISTVRRILARHHPSIHRLPRKPPSRPRALTKNIPMQRIPYNTAQPGHCEVDLVHHSGPNASGHYVHSLQMVDVATGWSERRAVLGRSWLVMSDAFRHILAHLPFQVQEVHSDNGSEFFNYHLLQFWGEAAGHIQLSRSRPYHKNDNPFVEQKNSSLIRAYLGHERLDTAAQTRLLNELYQKMGYYYNLFQPVMRLVAKVVNPATDERPARLQRRYDRPRTPFDRLCETDAISDQPREDLLALRQRINPRSLRKEIYVLRDTLFTLPGALRGVTENVHQTLHYPLELELPQEGTDRAWPLAWSASPTYNER